MSLKVGWPLVLLAILGTPCLANSPKINPAPVANLLPWLDAKSPDALAGILRQVLIEAMPTPLYEQSHNWGHTTHVAHAIHWQRQGILMRPKVVKTPRNDGTWKKIRVDALHPRDTLVLDIRDVVFPEPLRMTFGAFLAFDARANYEHFVWESGIRLWSGSVRARFRVKLHLDCEASARMEVGEGLLPDVVFRMHATKAHLHYDNLVVEHVPGIGGTTARLVGEGAQEMIRLLRPNLERQLLEKANAAIVRSVDTREVRVSLNNIFSKGLEQLKQGLTTK